MRNVLSELWHNIKSGALVNLILIAQLALFFWMSATISGYFLDISPTFTSNNIREDAAYYSMFYMPADEKEYGEMANAAGDPEYVSNLDKAYRELQEELGEHYLAIKYADLKLDYEKSCASIRAASRLPIPWSRETKSITSPVAPQPKQ